MGIIFKIIATTIDISILLSILKMHANASWPGRFIFMNRDIRFDNTSTADRGPAGVSLADRVYAHVSERILSGQWVSGDIINRKEVAAKLDVSLAPVSEALFRLRDEGFLEIANEPYRHTKVKVVREEDVRGQLALRVALERQALDMADGQRVRSAKPSLLKLAQEVDGFAPGDPASWPAEIAFHQAVVDLADCPALSACYERVVRCNYFFATNSPHIPILFPSRHSHTDYVEALCADDAAEADRATRATRDHYSPCREVLVEETERP